MSTRQAVLMQGGAPPIYFRICFFVIFITTLCLLVGLAASAEKKTGEFKSPANSAKEVSHQQSQTHAGGKTRSHLDKIYSRQSRSHSLLAEASIQRTLQALAEIYVSSVKPIETAYRYGDLNKDALLEEEILAKPLILFVGPWSTGKTTIINYLLNIEGSDEKLHTGAEPTTTDFIVLQNGTKYHTMTGMQLVSDKKKPFSILERYGQGFIQRLQGVELQSPLLDLVTLVDTPGIIETKKQQKRGYPFYEVLQWFMHRASLIFLVYDPTKLDAGLEVVFHQLKGYESKVKIIINKADTVNQQELLRVYGALFWNLAPLIQAVEPPRVYVGSFWSESLRDHPLSQLFLEEEKSLMLDVKHVIENWVEDKIANIRRHAFMVRLHALVVSNFLQAFRDNYGFFNFVSDEETVWKEIVTNPSKYGVFEKLLQQLDISKHDEPDTETYVNFFSHNQRDLFSPLERYCPFIFGWCEIDKLNQAIRFDLPLLLKSFKEQNHRGDYCTKEIC